MSKHSKKTKNIAAALSLLIFALFIVSYVAIPNLFQTEYDTGIHTEVALADETVNEVEIPELPPVVHIDTPESVKTIYMTACVAGTLNFRNDLVELIDETEINSIIIDIKDFSGTISFPTELLGSTGTGCKASDMKEFIELLHSKGVYVIGRITVFQDPLYTKAHPELAVKKASDGSVWKDHKGLSFIEVGAKPYWDYIVDLSRESKAIGFDELNFDYVRFPSDGNMKDIYYPFSENKVNADPDFGKAIALEDFFKFLKVEMDKLDITTSADLFGMTATNKDDLNIGQVLERALPYFDFIAPMVYPSHYPKNFNGWSNPNDHPYDIIHFSMTEAARRVEEMKSSTSTPQAVRDFISTDQLRPWIQDFDYGGDYGPVEVRAQIQATYDSGLDSWMIWAPSNRYTKGALKSE